MHEYLYAQSISFHEVAFPNDMPNQYDYDANDNQNNQIP